ncbi:MAG: DUF2569 family protein [Acidobacteria bacterium]|nr:DUF2569 family protein [Acidobacteriota bacterium]
MRSDSSGVRGWLLLLCRLLLVWQPLSLAVTASSALESLPLRGRPLAIILVVRVLVAALGIAAGLALQNRRAGAVGLAKIALIASAATDVFVYTTPYYPNNRPPGDTPFYIAASVAFCTVWLVYLVRSKRVQQTFS